MEVGRSNERIAGKNTAAHISVSTNFSVFCIAESEFQLPPSFIAMVILFVVTPQYFRTVVILLWRITPVSWDQKMDWRTGG